MSYIVVEVDGPVKPNLTEREVTILQNTILNLAAMTNALIVGEGVMLNPLDKGKMGITFAYPENISFDKENQIKDAFIKKLNTFFQMSDLELKAEITN